MDSRKVGKSVHLQNLRTALKLKPKELCCLTIRSATASWPARPGTMPSASTSQRLLVEMTTMMTTTTATRAKGSTVVPRAARQRMLTAARLLLWEGCAGRRGTSLFAWTQLGQRVAAVPSCDPASPPRHVICCFCFVFFFCDCVSRVLEG